MLEIHLVQNGMPIPVIAAQLAHASIKTTMETYLVITPELQRKFVENVLR
jgi:integrase